MGEEARSAHMDARHIMAPHNSPADVDGANATTSTADAAEAAVENFRREV